MEFCAIKRQWEEVMAKADSILQISKRPKSQMSVFFERKGNADFSVFTRNGIDYDTPLSPMDVAQKRVERLTSEKQRLKLPVFVIQPLPKSPTADCSNGNGSSCILQKIKSGIYETPNQRKIVWCFCTLNGNELTGSQDVLTTTIPNIIKISVCGKRAPEFQDDDHLKSAYKCKTCQGALQKKIHCSVCYDDVHRISTTNRNLMSTFCGHIFCDTCINRAIKEHPWCPVCRKKTTKKSVHKIYI